MCMYLLIGSAADDIIGRTIGHEILPVDKSLALLTGFGFGDSHLPCKEPEGRSNVHLGFLTHFPLNRF